MKRLIYLLVCLSIVLPAHAQISACVDSSGNADTPLCDANSELQIAGSQVEDAASATGHSGVQCLAVRDDVLEYAAGTSTDGDYGPIRFNAIGAVWTAATLQSDFLIDEEDQRPVKFAVIATDGADSDTLIAAAAGKRYRVLGYAVYCSAATDITFEDGDGTDITGTINLVANGNLGIVAPVSPYGQFETPTVNKTLSLLKSAAVDCDGHLTYIEID